MPAWLLGSGGWIPTGRRETTCVLIRRGEAALVLDAGTGARRLITEPALLEGVRTIEIVLTHFHLDHICGLAYVPALPVLPTVWAPGQWLYAKPSDELLGTLRSAPISPFEASRLGVIRELPGNQRVGGFGITARAQLKHWAPSAGLRVDDDLALVTDTAYDDGSAALAKGVAHLLHEAWSTSDEPVNEEGDATAAQAGQIAAAADARRLTLIHLNPEAADEEALIADARRYAPYAELGKDGTVLAT